MSFTNLNYLDSLVVKLRIKSIFSLIRLILYIGFLGFADMLIPIPEGEPLYVANISVVLVILMFFVSYNAIENFRFYLELRGAQKIYKDVIEYPDEPTEDSVNEFIQLGLDRYRETLEFEKSREIIILEKIHAIDKKCKEFKFTEDKDINGIMRSQLNSAMRSLYDGFNMKSPFTMPKFLYYNKWRIAQEDSSMNSEN